jgi:RIO-like serine/threonine protein kinase|tara:strand:- start:2001 stop:2294 length:294 start_codon:yes stop_codon:yes gene_type:complete
MNNNSNGQIYLSHIKYRVLKYISSFMDKHEYSPTFLEIGKKFHFSRARAGVIVAELYALHLISKGKSAHRKIRMDAEQISQIKDLKYNREYSTHEHP